MPDSTSGFCGVRARVCVCVFHMFGDDIAPVAYNSTFLSRKFKKHHFPRNLGRSVHAKGSYIWGVKYLCEAITVLKGNSVDGGGSIGCQIYERPVVDLLR